jgi:hypothetical protein
MMHADDEKMILPLIHLLASERNAGILFEHFKGNLVMLGKMLSISRTIKKNAQKVCSSRVFFDRRPPLRR